MKKMMREFKKIICVGFIPIIICGIIFEQNVNSDSAYDQNEYVGFGADSVIIPEQDDLAGRFTWGLVNIKVPQAWQKTRGDPRIVVAVMDSGIDYLHRDLNDSMWTNLAEIPNNNIDDDRNGYVDDIHGWDFQDQDNDSLAGSTIHYHGTFSAGLIAAQINETHIAGVAPNIRIMDLRVLDHRDAFKRREWTELTAALHYAIDNGARIVNMSFVSEESPPADFLSAVRRAVSNNVFLVGATGNWSRDVLFPAKYEEVLAVGAVDKENEIAPISSEGPEVDLVAPGINVESLLPDHSYGTSTGTSWSAAYVSGAIALLLSDKPALNVQEIKAELLASAVDLGMDGPDETFGHGLIDVARLLTPDETSN